MQHFEALANKTIVFIGGGNMAGAIIGGLLKLQTKQNLPLTLGVCDTNAQKRQSFAQLGLLVATPDNMPKLIERADVVVLAVKPQSLAQVAPTLVPYLAGKLVLSVLAGVGVLKLTQALNTTRIVCCMPNLPASIGMGATGLFSQLASADNDIAEQIMQSCGITMWVKDESHLHAVTAVAGSAPAYFFYVLEHMVAQATAMGLNQEDAKRLASQSMIGAGLLAKDGDPSTLRAQVTSKGGTTAAALDTLTQNNVGEAFELAMQACAKRSQELGAG